MQTTSGIQQGQVVRSLAGRDKDRYFLALEVVDETYVLLVDDKLRKLAGPKKKRTQHVQILKQWMDLDQEELNDSKIRKALKVFNEPRRV